MDAALRRRGCHGPQFVELANGPSAAVPLSAWAALGEALDQAIGPETPVVLFGTDHIAELAWYLEFTAAPGRREFCVVLGSMTSGAGGADSLADMIVGAVSAGPIGAERVALWIDHDRYRVRGARKGRVTRDACAPVALQNGVDGIAPDAGAAWRGAEDHTDFVQTLILGPMVAFRVAGGTRVVVAETAGRHIVTPDQANDMSEWIQGAPDRLVVLASTDPTAECGSWHQGRIQGGHGLTARQAHISALVMLAGNRAGAYATKPWSWWTGCPRCATPPGS